MTKRKNLSKAQLDLKQRVINAYSKPHGFLYVHPTWGTKLWKKSTSDIYEFLEGRFRETLDVVEYYSTLVLLWKTLPNSELLVEFHDSPQWIKAFGMIGTCNHLDQKQTTNKSKQPSVKRGAQPIETVKSVDTIRVIGNE
jgi:hypothetical protein